MNTLTKSLCTALLGLGIVSTYAQSGVTPKARPFGGFTEKLFGTNTSYSAVMEVKTGKSDATVSRVFVDDGRTRNELDMTASMGSKLPPEVAAQMRAAGMSKQVLLSLPEKNAIYQIHTQIRGYLEISSMIPKAATAKTESDYKLEATALGKETIERHPCVKNKVIVTDNDGHQKEYTVWNATDLNNFPIKIEGTTSLDEPQTTIYKGVRLGKQDAKLFELPANYRKYTDVSAMMQDMMMKQLSTGAQ